MAIILSNISNFSIIYTLADYYHNNIPDDVEYWNDDEVQRQIEQCYEEYELQKDVEALIEERSWDVSFRYMSIQRIAREAREKRKRFQEELERKEREREQQILELQRAEAEKAAIQQKRLQEIQEQAGGDSLIAV